jgi:hypothetical protein
LALDAQKQIGSCLAAPGLLADHAFQQWEVFHGYDCAGSLEAILSEGDIVFNLGVGDLPPAGYFYRIEDERHKQKTPIAGGLLEL